MDKFKIRHFIICQGLDIDKESFQFTASGVYEYFSAKSYPSLFDFHAVVGMYFFQRGETYTAKIILSQNNVRLGGFLFENMSVDKDNEIMNVILNAEISIPDEGPVQFDIIVNDEIVDTQIVQALKED